MDEKQGSVAERRAAARASWEQVIGEYAASGGTAAAFCRERGLRVWQFRYWLKALRQAEAAVRRRPSFPAPADPLLVWGTGLAVLLLAAFIGVLAWPRYYAHALKYLQLAIKNDNTQGWGDDARKLLARINAQMMGDPKQI